MEQWRARIVDQQRHEIERSVHNLRNLHPLIFTYWNVEAVRQEIEAALASPKPSVKAISGINQAIASLSALSSWWQSLDN